MAKVIRDGLMFCQDCTMAAANDDYTGLSYLGEEEATSRASFIKAKLGSLGGHAVPGDTEREFSWRACDCCESSLGGSRYEFLLLGDS